MRDSSSNKSSQRRSFGVNQEPRVRISGTLLFLCAFLILFWILNSRGPHHQNESVNLQMVNTLNLTRSARDKPPIMNPSQFLSAGENLQGGEFEVKWERSEMLLLEKLIEINSKDRQNELIPQTPQSKPQNIVPQVLRSSKKERLYEQLVRYTLQAVKNFKLTTPKNAQKDLFASIKSLFVPFGPYRGIQQMLSEGEEVWDIQTPYAVLTVRSDRQIVPHVIELSSASSETEKLYLLGLELTIQNQLIPSKLGKYELAPGLNLIECSQNLCNKGYAMLLFKISRVKIKSLKIHRKVYL